MLQLDIHTFSRKFFHEYAAWFEDDSVKKYLGGIDAEWLEHIENQTDGVELAICCGDELYCVLGLVYPTDEHNYYVITNIAVKPKYRSRGIAEQALQLIMQKAEFQKSDEWRCYVESDNIPAQKLFEKLQWNKLSENDSMLEYRQKKSSNN